MIEHVSSGKEVSIEIFPYNLRRLIESSEEITFLLKLFKGFKIN